jgi:Ca-activated chloride channel homolog
MKTKRYLLVLLVVMWILSACAPAAATPRATQAPIAVQPMAQATQMPYPTTDWTNAPTQAPAEAARPAYAATATAPSPWGGAQPSAPQDNTFRDYGVNPYTDTRNDHLSTFGLDVDTASYTVARRYVNGGSLPPAESVRPEEFVNYFKQGYPRPNGTQFAIFTDGARSPFPSKQTYFMRVGIQGYEVPDWERKPLSLTFVIDVSGSMRLENRLGLVKRTLQLLVDRLGPQDTVAIIVYGTNARSLLAPTHGDQRDYILSAIYSLSPEGSTNAEAGLTLGYRTALSMFQPGAVNRVILCTDGVANTGQTSPDALLDEIHGYVSEGITLTSLGFGMGNFNDVLLEQMADRGNGNYAYIDSLEQAVKLFIDDLTGTMQVIARDARVQVDFNPDVVAAYRLVGYENRALSDQNFRKDNQQVQEQAGEVGSGHTVTALYAVELCPGAEGRLATVQLRWKDPDTSETHEINGNFNTWGLYHNFNEATPRFQLAVVAGEYAEILRDSPWVPQEAAYSLANAAQQLSGMMPEDPDVAELASLMTRAMQLKGENW